MDDNSMIDYTLVPWRTGQKVGRTIYAQVLREPSPDDVLIGMMDTYELAVAAVTAHNDILKAEAFNRRRLTDIYLNMPRSRSLWENQLTPKENDA